MVDEWFIKRGEKISGPFKLAKINAAMKEGKIRPTDSFCETPSGSFLSGKEFARKVAADLRNEGATSKHSPKVTDSESMAVESFGDVTDSRSAATDLAETPSEQIPRLVECDDCGSRISRRAKACPHCGSPRVTDERKDVAPDLGSSSKISPLGSVGVGGSPKDGRMTQCPGCLNIVSYWATLCPMCGMPEPANAKSGASHITVKFEGIWMLIDCTYKVFIDGNPIGIGKVVKGGANTTEVESGLHNLIIKGPLGRSYSHKLKILPGVSYNVDLIYSRESGWFNNCTCNYTRNNA